MSHRDNFIFFWIESFFFGAPLGGDCECDGVLVALSPSMSRALDAGGPTGTTREPNSTPMVTSWVGENRPSQSRIDNCREKKLVYLSPGAQNLAQGTSNGDLRLTCPSLNHRYRRALLCSPMVVTFDDKR